MLFAAVLVLENEGMFVGDNLPVNDIDGDELIEIVTAEEPDDDVHLETLGEYVEPNDDDGDPEMDGDAEFRSDDEVERDGLNDALCATDVVGEMDTL